MERGLPDAPEETSSEQPGDGEDPPRLRVTEPAIVRDDWLRDLREYVRPRDIAVGALRGPKRPAIAPAEVE